VNESERLVVRQAIAGMLWIKQHYGYDVERWLAEHDRDPADPVMCGPVPYPHRVRRPGR
jgi:hypothetical protein